MADYSARLHPQCQFHLILIRQTMTFYVFFLFEPEIRNQIADQLFTNKTFGEIFDMLGGGYVQREAIAPPPLDGSDVWVAGNPNLAKAYDLIDGSLLQVGPLVDDMLNGYRQMLMTHVNELDKILTEFRQKVPFLSQDQLERVMNTSLKFLFLN